MKNGKNILISDKMIPSKKPISSSRKKLALRSRVKNPRVEKIESYILRRFDPSYLRDFKRVWRKNPNEALDLLKKWEEF